MIPLSLGISDGVFHDAMSSILLHVISATKFIFV